MSSKLFQLKHELWLKMLFASFAINDERIKDILYDYSHILFRHLKWISNDLKDKDINYDYSKSSIDIQQDTNFAYFKYLTDEINEIKKEYNDSVLCNRMQTDEEFFIKKLQILLSDESNDARITAFNKERVYENKEMDKSQTDALTYFLFEESYKEYELIMVYFYMQNYTDNLTLYNVYQDLIDESHFHLKCFGNMLSKMGILSIPRMIHPDIYTATDIKRFLLDGIKEEEGAKEECRKLAAAVKDEELSKFFDFINFQESYHIELMYKALERL